MRANIAVNSWHHFSELRVSRWLYIGKQ